jgi:DNA-binding transcriptional MerR regulator
MQNFSIKDIENLTGIKAHTLRIWEKRYNLIVSKRKDSKHRYFDNEDLKTILRITYLYESDFKISQIAKLSKEAITSFAHIDHSNSKSIEAYILQLINAIIEYDAANFQRIFKTAIKQYGFEKAILELGYGLLRRIGLLWLTDHLIPAQEHFASNLIKNILINAIEELPKSTTQSTEETILFTPTGEHHELPLLFANWLFKKNVRKTCYLGANISIDELAYCTKKRNVTYLFFHLISNLTGKNITDYTAALLIKFPSQTIIVSGAQAKDIKISSPKLIKLKSLDELRSLPINFKILE